MGVEMMLNGDYDSKPKEKQFMKNKEDENRLKFMRFFKSEDEKYIWKNILFDGLKPIKQANVKKTLKIVVPTLQIA